MIKIIGVRFRNAGKIYYFDPKKLPIKKGDHVIVETARGIEYGSVVADAREVTDDQVVQPLKPVIRIANADDNARAQRNKEKEKEAFRICLEKIRKHKLEMKLIDTEYTFDNNKVLFYFTADGRIDFRELVKDLASVFKTRIELRQIGVRDETKVVGGVGICGREQDGKGAESVSESDQDLRCLRPSHVLPEKRGGHLRVSEQPSAGYRRPGDCG